MSCVVFRVDINITDPTMTYFRYIHPTRDARLRVQGASQGRRGPQLPGGGQERCRRQQAPHSRDGDRGRQVREAENI